MPSIRSSSVSVALPLFAGWFACAALFAISTPLDVRADFGARIPESLAREPPTELDLRITRELRALPAIGPARSIAITRAKWQSGMRNAPESWDRVPGIGPETVTNLRRWVREHGARAVAHGRSADPRR
jgi:hypothetical protein